MTTHENDLYAISERLSVTKMLNFAGPGRCAAVHRQS